MNEELEILAEMAAEIAKKYNMYLTACSFYGADACITYQSKEDEGSSKFTTI